MKNFLILLLAGLMLAILGGCIAETASDTEKITTPSPILEIPTEAVESTESASVPETDSKSLVCYFSATGTTKGIAEEIVSQTGADVFEIVPSEPYTDADLNYNDDNCRANREMNDESARPEIADAITNFSEYDTIFIGYPIWWGTMPRIINTLLDNYDFSGKIIIPFCTSGGSGISQSVEDIKTAVPGAEVREGLRAASAADVSPWLERVYR